MSAVPGAFERLVDDLVMGQVCPVCCAPAGMRCGADHRPLHKARRSAALAALNCPPVLPRPPGCAVSVSGTTPDAPDTGHPVWCSPAHCFVTEEGMRVHQQAPTSWEAQYVVPVRFETRLIDPGDDADTYLELHLHDLTLRHQFYALLPLDIARWLRDQLTTHLDAVQ